MESDFLRKLNKEHPELDGMMLNEAFGCLVDYLHQKGLVDMEDFFEFLESRMLAEKMARQPEPAPVPKVKTLPKKPIPAPTPPPPIIVKC